MNCLFSCFTFKWFRDWCRRSSKTDSDSDDSLRAGWISDPYPIPKTRYGTDNTVSSSYVPPRLSTKSFDEYPEAVSTRRKSTTLWNSDKDL